MVERTHSRILRHLEGPYRAAIVARYNDKVKRGQAGECWPWTAGIGAGGYGCFKVAHGVSAQSHRLALIIATSQDPKGLEAAHSCGFGLCCNPSHLRWATRQENEDDKRLSRLNGQVPA